MPRFDQPHLSTESVCFMNCYGRFEPICRPGKCWIVRGHSSLAASGSPRKFPPLRPVLIGQTTRRDGNFRMVHTNALTIHTSRITPDKKEDNWRDFQKLSATLPVKSLAKFDNVCFLSVFRFYLRFNDRNVMNWLACCAELLDIGLIAPAGTDCFTWCSICTSWTRKLNKSIAYKKK